MSLDKHTVLATAIHEVTNMMLELSLGLGEYKRQHADAEIARMHGLSMGLQNRLMQILILQTEGEDRLAVNAEVTNPGDFLDEVSDDARLMMSRDIDLEVQNEVSDVPFWFIDRHLVAQVLINVLHNAFKFTHSKVKLVCRVHEGELVFSISDDGAGYPDLPGGSADPVKADAKGTGLGLLFNERIATAHGGRVSRWNDAGAHFILSLPRGKTS